MTTKVLDSWALLAFFKGEPAGEAVEELMNKASVDRVRLLLCTVNWGEVYYGMWRAAGPQAAQAVADDLGRLPLELVDADLELARRAAEFKAVNRMSFADAFAAAVASLNRAELVTGDPEFKPLDKEIKIQWLRPVK
jgi:predicted nucleic acid-binding protein